MLLEQVGNVSQHLHPSLVAQLHEPGSVARSCPST